MSLRLAARAVVLLTVLTAVLLSAPGPAAAAPAIQRTKVSGLGADALFSTVPRDEALVPGTTYTDTSVSFAEQVAGADGMIVRDSVVVTVFTLTVDSDGEVEILSTVSGQASGADFTGNRRLRSGRLSAVVPMTLCEQRGCRDAGRSSLRATWTGIGRIDRQADVSHERTPAYTYMLRHRTIHRDAHATATLDGAALGEARSASLYHHTGAERLLCRTGPCER